MQAARGSGRRPLHRGKVHGETLACEGVVGGKCGGGGSAFRHAQTVAHDSIACDAVPCRHEPP